MWILWLMPTLQTINVGLFWLVAVSAGVDDGTNSVSDMFSWMYHPMILY